MAFNSILVANRGEIACRILRSARKQGLRTVAVFSDADRGAPHVSLADEALPIGSAPAADSYLNADNILGAALDSGAESIHPGYGFLSENAHFAQAVTEAGLVFIGPPADAIRSMGDKIQARQLMMAANVPCVPGYDGDDQSDDDLIRAADTIGFPVMLKAAAGGGGRGMRLVTSPTEFQAALPIVRTETSKAFGSDRLFVEKAITGARHVEFQIFADSYGQCIHLAERDCSVQRRHQKVVEEAPGPAMSQELREQMGDAAVAAAKAVNYCGAGTIEFLLDRSGAFYFLEMNTRLQVEHPVTELITGLDLVAWQIKVAQGEALPLSQEDVSIDGHAIEARLYAEDPARDFLPDTGRIDLWRPSIAEGIRIDDGITSGQQISPYYDPLLAKIIAWGKTREIARERLVKAAEETVLLGVSTNLPFLSELLRSDDFVQARITTEYVDSSYPNGMPAAVPPAADVALAVALMLNADRRTSVGAGAYVSKELLGWSNVAPLTVPVRISISGAGVDVSAICSGSIWTVNVDDVSFSVEILSEAGNMVHADIDGRVEEATIARTSSGNFGLAINDRRWSVERVRETALAEVPGADGQVAAPMPGLVSDVLVNVGRTVQKGDALIVLEAMKMQHQINAPSDGVVLSVSVARGDRTGTGDLLIEIGKTGEPD